jgi:iron complex outermembrane recepter protein
MGVTGFITICQSAATTRQFTRRIAENQGFIWKISAMKYSLMTILFFCAAFAHSQVRGKLKTDKGEPVASVNVIVHRAADSSRVTGGSSDDQGLFEITRLTSGSYYCRISSLGYITAYSNVFTIAGDTSWIVLPDLLLTAVEAVLGEVVVTAKKELIKFTPGGKIFNVQASLLTKGSNALQVLERLPGVMTDRRNNQFSLNGQTGVTVLFNGRRVGLSMEELMNLLESTVADNIDKIELITSPDAKYDADGSGGIINVIFRKSEQEGTRVNASATVGYGYRGKAVGSVALSHGFKNASVLGSYSYLHDGIRSGFMGNGTNEDLLYNGSTFATFSGISRRFQHSHNFSLAGEIRASPKSTVGGDMAFSTNKTHNLSNNDGTWEFDNGDCLRYAALSEGTNRRHNISASVYSKHKLFANTQLNLDASYIHYANNSPAVINGKYYDRLGNPIIPADPNFTSGNRGESFSGISALTFSMDLTSKLGKSVEAEFGSKGSTSENSNDSKVERLVNGQWVIDPRSQSVVNSREKIGAIYTQFRLLLNARSSLHIGLRYEYWRRDIGLFKEPFIIGKIFPSFLYNKTIANGSTLSVGYNRRISRPAYTDLVSNLFYNDPTFVFSGNPLLKPTISDIFKATFNQKRLNVSLSFQVDRHPVLRYQITSNETKEIGISSPQNLDYQRNINLAINYSLQPATWWKINVGSTTSLRNYKVSYSLQPAVKTFVFQNLTFNQQLQLPWRLEAELNGWYNFRFYEGTNIVRGFGLVNFALAKKLKNDKGSFQLSLPDLFRSFRVHTHIGGMTPIAFNINTHATWRDETAFYRVIKLTYSRSFGKSSIRSAIRNSRSEEAERIQ